MKVGEYPQHGFSQEVRLERDIKWKPLPSVLMWQASTLDSPALEFQVRCVSAKFVLTGSALTAYSVKQSVKVAAMVPCVCARR